MPNAADTKGAGKEESFPEQIRKFAKAAAGAVNLTPDDVKFIAVVSLQHRLILKPEPRIRGVLPEDILKKLRDLPNVLSLTQLEM